VRLLLVEDDESIAEQLVQALQKDGYRVDWSADGADGLASATLQPYAVILLDWMLPELSGEQVCRRLRSSGVSTPILMLTARDTTKDKVHGLDSGADDYLAKPFDYPELTARIRALTRRESNRKARIIYAADLEIDTQDRTVRRSSEVLAITPKEYAILEGLARNIGRVISREQIIEDFWNEEVNDPNVINFHMTTLRRKIDVGRPQSLIETVHGFGYRLRSGGA
jgi:DNA-binding response OmpR family regulator